MGSCGKCRGVGGFTCHSCSGAGSTQCFACSGNGMVGYSDTRSTCTSCGGSGRFNCYECTAGKINCDSCYGSGQVRDSDSSWTSTVLTTAPAYPFPTQPATENTYGSSPAGISAGFSTNQQGRQERWQNSEKDLDDQYFRDWGVRRPKLEKFGPVGPAPIPPESYLKEMKREEAERVAKEQAEKEAAAEAQRRKEARKNNRWITFNKISPVRAILLFGAVVFLAWSLIP